MNNTLDCVFNDLIRLLRDDVIPRLEDSGLRAQTFGAIFMLKNLQLRVDWASEPLVEQIRAQDELFNRLRELDIGDVALPDPARLDRVVPNGKMLLAWRDEGNVAVSKLISNEPTERSATPPTNAVSQLDQLIAAYMRIELDIEMRHTPKPMFAEMSSGKSP